MAEPINLQSKEKLKSYTIYLPNLSKSREIKKIYIGYCKAEGSQHIASEYAIIKIQELIENFQVKRIMEIGLGIGSIAGSLLNVNPNLKYLGTEANNFCLMALTRNLKDVYPRLNIFSALKEVPKSDIFDIIVIDGKDPMLELISGFIAQNGIIVIEGDRLPQQKEILKFFPRHLFVHSISDRKNKKISPFSPNHWQGGLKIIFVNPDLKQKVWWLKEKLKTRIKYFYRT